MTKEVEENMHKHKDEGSEPIPNCVSRSKFHFLEAPSLSKKKRTKKTSEE